MKVEYSNSKEYILKSDDDAFLGKLVFENWTATKANITTQFGEFFDIATKGFWGTSMSISKSGVEFSELKMNWKGEIVIDMSANGKGEDYLLKSYNLWMSQFCLQNRDKKEIMIITPDYKWSKWHYNFKIEVNPDFKDMADEILTLISIYGILYIMMMTGAAVAASV
jgi:hypothetical protein